MTSEEIIARRVGELDAELELAQKQLVALRNCIQGIKVYAENVAEDRNYSLKCPRLSNEAWRNRASEMIKELTTVDKVQYPSPHSVKAKVYIVLRDHYGVVLEQLRKDFKYKHNTLRSVSTFEAISDDPMVRDIFDAVLQDLFPEEYYEDEILTLIEGGGNDESVVVEKPNPIAEVIKPLAIISRDDSYEYVDTFERVCANLDCAWHNLQVRYMKKNNLTSPPSKMTIIANNDTVFRKFKKIVRAMVENYSTV